MRTVLAFAVSVLGAVLLVPILLLFLPFWLVSTCTRALARRFEPEYLTRDELIEFDPAIGWKPRANLNCHHLMVDLFQISTDAQGWRGRSSLAESDIVVFGDSFAAGYGVSDEQLFANLTTRPRIKPIGIGGYSMVQEFLWMRLLAGDLRDKIVVWFIYVGNDLYDNLSPELRGYRKPFVKEVRATGGWEIVSAHVDREKWPIVPRVRKGHIHMAKLAELCSDTFLAHRAFAACEFLIQEGKRLCRDAGAELVVLTIPEAQQLSSHGQRYLRSLTQTPAFDPDAPDKRIQAICGRLEVPFVAGKRVLDVSCYKKNDCHWNPLGHRRVAQLLSDLFAQRQAGTIASWDAVPGSPLLTGTFDPAAKSIS